MSELLKEYYKLQYDRIAQHEGRRMQFSNLAIVTSSAVITIGIRLDCGQAFGVSIVIAVLLIAINVAAILFIDKSRQWIKFHQLRAKKILEKYDQDLNEIVESVEKADSSKDPLSLINIQKYLHMSLLGLAVLYPVVIYLICRKP
ncbi:MAG: hypothetical protein ACFB8W_10745 [Elainellaceae cyanobacterium]